VEHGSAESGAMKGLGKPCAGEQHARFDERGLETGYGLGTAAPAARCVDSAGPIDYRASPRLYPDPDALPTNNLAELDPDPKLVS
jgi:hypothetical protein